MDRHHKHHSSHSDTMQQDVAAAHAAWDAWKSNDPEAWDFALSEKQRISRHNPAAWQKAMQEVDVENAHKTPIVLPVRKDCAEYRPPAAQPEYLDTTTPPPPYPNKPVEAPPPPVHPGYQPQTEFAPPPPDSPAFNAAYNRPQPEFYGLNLAIVKLGVNSNGSLDAGVNIGIARAEVQAGLENRVEGEFMPIGGPLHARAGAGVGINQDGVHSEVGAGANFFNVVNGDADFGARAGANTGVDGDVRGNVGPVHVQSDAGAGVGTDGVGAYTGANTGIGNVFDVRSGARFDLGRNSGAAAGVGVQAGDTTVDFGPSVDTYGNKTVRPRIHLDEAKSGQGTFYPTGDRQVDATE